MRKLTRQQITEGLDQFPVEVLLSAGPGKKAALTTKQKEFARHLAMGKTKAQAYRDSREGTPAPSTIVCQPYKLAADARIQQEVEAYKLAIEAEKHRTPVQLKALLVQQLVQHSLDPEFPPAQRVQCLKLLGSLFEVGAFVERKEVTTVSKSGDIRQRILETLKDVTDVTEVDKGLDLLTELAQAKPSQADDSQDGPGLDNPSTANPTTGAPAAFDPAAGAARTHSIPDTQSLEKSIQDGQKSTTEEDPPLSSETENRE